MSIFKNPLLFFLVLMVGCSGPSLAVDEVFQDLGVGHSKEDVLQVLGQPDFQDKEDDTLEIWSYYHLGGEFRRGEVAGITVFFKNERVVRVTPIYRG